MSYASDAAAVYREAARQIGSVEMASIAEQTAIVLEVCESRTKDEVLVALQKALTDNRCKRDGHGERDHWDTDDMWAILAAVRSGGSE